MRPSTARLAGAPVRLSQLVFPRQRVHVHRTRLTFIHLDNLLHFAKIDRDGRVDGFVAAYLPHELALLLLRGGELRTAVAFTESGRTVISIASALKRIRQEVERGELIYANAPLEQVAWMYQSCASPAAPKFVDPGNPADLVSTVEHELFTGVLELMCEGQVNYLRFEDGRFLNAYLCNQVDDLPVATQVQRMLAKRADGSLPQIAAAVFPSVDDLPEQASPALIQSYREMFWQIATLTEAEVPQEAMKRAYRIRDALAEQHDAIEVIGTPLDRDAHDLVATPDELTDALSAWALQLLEEIEVIAPGVAPAVLKTATKEHRFMLQRAGFYERLPWPVSW